MTAWVPPGCSRRRDDDFDRLYIQAFALTLAIELPIYGFVLTGRYQVGPLRALALGLFINVVTHPNVWFVLQPLLAPSLGYLGYVAIAELFAWWVEAVLMWAWLRRDFRGLIALSLLANSAFYAFGALMMDLFAF